MRKIVLLVLMAALSNAIRANEGVNSEKILDESSLNKLGLEIVTYEESDSIQFDLHELNKSVGIESIEFAIAKSDGELIFSQYLSKKNDSPGPLFSFRKYDLDSSFEYIFLLHIDCNVFSKFRSCSNNGGEFLFRLPNSYE